MVTSCVVPKVLNQLRSLQQAYSYYIAEVWYRKMEIMGKGRIGRIRRIRRLRRIRRIRRIRSEESMIHMI